MLSKLLIKNSDDYSDPTVRRRYGILCGSVGVALNILLSLGKFIAGLSVNSIAIIADAANNLSDAGSSVITMAGFKLAGQKPDPAHPFGHGRIEYISGLIVSMAILLMGFELLKTSVEKIFSPEETVFSIAAIVILCASIAVKLYIFFYNKKSPRNKLLGDGRHSDRQHFRLPRDSGDVTVYYSDRRTGNKPRRLLRG